MERSREAVRASGRPVGGMPALERSDSRMLWEWELFMADVRAGHEKSYAETSAELLQGAHRTWTPIFLPAQFTPDGRHWLHSQQGKIPLAEFQRTHPLPHAATCMCPLCLGPAAYAGDG